MSAAAVALLFISVFQAPGVKASGSPSPSQELAIVHPPEKPHPIGGHTPSEEQTLSEEQTAPHHTSQEPAVVDPPSSTSNSGSGAPSPGGTTPDIVPHTGSQAENLALAPSPPPNGTTPTVPQSNPSGGPPPAPSVPPPLPGPPPTLPESNPSDHPDPEDGSTGGEDESEIEDPFKANPKLAGADENLKTFSKNLKESTAEMAKLYEQVGAQMKSYQDAMKFLANNVRDLQRNMKVMLKEEGNAVTLRNAARMEPIAKLDKLIAEHHKELELDPSDLDLDPSYGAGADRKSVV